MSVSGSVSSQTKQNIIGVQGSHIKLGIIGTANVGKSTLFNAFIRDSSRFSQVEPSLFCTVDPNVATFIPKDTRIEYIGSVFQSRVVPARVTVADTGGIVRGSFSENKGVGVTSLQACRHCDMVVHLLRHYADDDICHYEGSPDPVRDFEIVNEELLLTDLDLIEAELTVIETILQRGNGGDYTQFQRVTLLKAFELVAGVPRLERPKLFKKKITLKKMKIPESCAGGLPLRNGVWDAGERAVLAEYNFITAKKVVYLVNMTSRDFLRPDGAAQQQVLGSIRTTIERVAKDAGETVRACSLAFEQNLTRIVLDEGPQALEEYFAANPTHMSAIDSILHAAYSTLDLVHFYTASDREVKCYALKHGKNIVEASALVDVKIARNFMRGDVVNYLDFHQFHGDRLKIMMEGKLKQETKKYLVNDGDIIDFFHHGMDK